MAIAIEFDEIKDLNLYEERLDYLPHTQIYSSPAYWRFVADVSEGELHWLCARDRGQTVGVFPWVGRNSPEGYLINSLPWFGSHGGCTLVAEGDAEVRTELLRAFAEEVSREQVVGATCILSLAENAHVDEYREELAPIATDDRIGQMTYLPSHEGDPGAALGRLVTRKTRNAVRKAMRQGFSNVQTDEEWAWRFLSDTHDANIRALGGRPKAARDFAALRHHLRDAIRLSVALDGETPVAALLLVRHNHTIEYITPAIVAEHRSRQPLSFLLWESLVEAIREGCARWNWGGTHRSQVGVHHFKKSWGAIDAPYSYLVCSRLGLTAFVARAQSIRVSAPSWYVFPDHLLA